MSEVKVKTVFIGGTGAIKPFAMRYYQKVEKACAIDLLVVLPNGGRIAIEDSYPQVAAFIERKLGDQQMIVIGHSQGALHAIRYAAAHPNVVRVIIIGAPIQGTLLCLAMAVAPPIVRRNLAAVLDMHPGSQFLADLVENHLPVVRDRLVTISCQLDGLVWPASSGHVWGAKNHWLPIWENHITMVVANRTLQIVRDVQDQAEIELGWPSSAAVAA